MTEAPPPGRPTLTAGAAFAGMAGVAFVVIVGLGLGMTFFADEWAFIESRSLTDPATWWGPHNEHWSTLPILLYRLMVESIGIGSYVPYLAVAALLHILVAGLLYRLLARAAGPTIAIVAAAIVLAFGSGFENLFWGFQTGFVGSVAFGLAAMDVTDRGPTRGRALIVAALLLGSLASSSVGIAMSVAVGVEWLLDPRWRRWVPALAGPVLAWLAWYAMIGRVGVATFRDPLSIPALLDVPPAVMRGISNAFAAISGLPVAGLAIAALLALWRAGTRAAIRWPRLVGCVAAIGLLYAFIGAARGGLFDAAVDYTRYTYVSGILAMLALGIVIGPVRLPAAGRPRLAALGAIGCWLALALVVNVQLLLAGREVFLDRADMTRALVVAALDPDRPATVDLDRSLVLVPSPASLQRIVAAFGDPRGDALVPGMVRRIPPEVMAEARRRLVEGAPIFLPDDD